jgi:hypothetical protein
VRTVGRPRTLIALAAIVPVLLGPAARPSDDRGRWSAQQTVGTLGYANAQNSSEVAFQLAVGANGEAAAAWVATDGLRVAIARPGRAFGPSRLLARTTDAELALAVDDRGDVAVAWDYLDGRFNPDVYARESPCCDHVRVAMLRPSGRAASMQTLTPRGSQAQPISIAIAPDGSSAAVLFDIQNAPARDFGDLTTAVHLRVRVAHFGRPFARAAQLPVNGDDAFDYVASVADRADGVTATYGSPVPHHGTSEVTEERIGEAHVTRGGTLTGETTVGTLPFALDGTERVLPQVDAAGDRAIVDVASRDDLVLGAGPSAAPLQPMLVDRARQGLSELGLAVAPSGRALVSWGVGATPTALQLSVGRLPFGPLQRLPALRLPHDDFVDAPATAIDSRGQSAVVVNADTGAEQESVIAALGRPGAGLDAPLNIGGPAGAAPDSTPQVVVDPQGRGIAAWASERGNDTLLIARRFRAP